MRRQTYLKGFALLLLLSLCSLVSYWAGRWHAGDFDLLCGSDFHDYRSRIALRDEHGLQLPAGTQFKLRFCEYNAQAQLEVLIDKSEFSTLEPLDNPTGARWRYNLQPD